MPYNSHTHFTEVHTHTIRVLLRPIAVGLYKQNALTIGPEL